MKKKLFVSTIFLLCIVHLFAQENTSSRFFRQNVSRKGTLYTSWGYNHSSYTKSDVTFKGNEYEFTLKQMNANDKQEPFSFSEYFNPVSLTIPQYNFDIGYYFNDRYSISINVDHMKYVMVQDQTVKIDGYINEKGNQFDGNYNGNDIQLTADFLTFEHTDGLNYVNIAGNGIQEIYGSSNRKFIVSGISSFGAGILLPKSNVKLFNYPRNDAFHLAGFGVSGQLALNFTFWQKIFIQANCKGGYIDMPDIVTRGGKIGDRAKQNFYFLQTNMMFGVLFKLKK
jgi:hypothetical protein